MDHPTRLAGISRRDLALAAAAAVPLLAQEAAKTEDDLAASRENMRRNSDAIRKFALPLTTEPSFIFRP